METRILVFGDSEVYGAWDSKGGWVQRLRAVLDKEEEYYEVHNLGISGNTTNNLLKRFEFETKQRLLTYMKNTAIIIGIGGNDAALLKDKNKQYVPAQKFKSNLNKLIALARKYTNKIVFIGPIIANEKLTTPIFWDKNLTYMNKYYKQYDAIMSDVCKKRKVHFLGLHKSLKRLQNANILYADGLHLNTKGHKFVFEIVRDFLVKNKIINVS